MILSPADAVMLDRRICEERMISLYPPCAAPDWVTWIFTYSFVPFVCALRHDGIVAPRCLADEIDWSTTVAVRFETPWGDAIDPRDNEPGELDWSDYE